MPSTDSDAGPGLVMGLVASPGAATDLAERLLVDVTERLNQTLPGARWTVRLVSDRLVDLPADLTQLIGAARRRLLADGWHLAVCLTDLPLPAGRGPRQRNARRGRAVLWLLGRVGSASGSMARAERDRVAAAGPGRRRWTAHDRADGGVGGHLPGWSGCSALISVARGGEPVGGGPRRGCGHPFAAGTAA